MVTTELRTDPITGRSVLIESSAGRRREDFDLPPVRLEDPPAECPFCEGHEADAGHELLAWREGGPANTPGWSVRVVPNRHPMLRIEGGTDVHRDGLFEWRDGLGAHEVIIETPIHDQPLQSLVVDRLWRVLWAWRTRLQDLKRDMRFEAAVVFKNHGRGAGARLDHSHSQIAAYPILPVALDEELRGSSSHFSRTKRCIFCDLIARELKDGRRVIKDGKPVVALAPYASRVPFETWILPTDHGSRFEDATDAVLEGAASLLKDMLTRIDWALERPAYNLVLHTAPFKGDLAASFHWHLEIIPRVSRWSGLEWGSGIPRNPVSPEEAAAALRECRAEL